MSLDRISVNTQVMGGRPCIKGTRVTVGTIVGQLGEDTSKERILELYPYITVADINQCLQYAAMRSEEMEVEVDFGTSVA